MVNESENENAALSEEEVAFAQAMKESEESWLASGSFGGGFVPSPLEQKAEAETETPEEAQSSSPEEKAALFAGLSEEQWTEKLEALEKMEDRLLNKLMGHLGPIGRELKTLREASGKEVQFDVEALAPLKALDEDLHNALVAGLTKGLKVQNASELVRPFIEEQVRASQGAFALSVQDAVEQRLLETLLPNYLTISESPGFTDWILKNASADVVQAFRDWDSEGQGKKNASALLSGYKAFMEAKQKSESIKNAREDTLKRSAVPAKSSGAVARATSSKNMTEEEAFAARMQEIEEKGLRL